MVMTIMMPLGFRPMAFFSSLQLLSIGLFLSLLRAAAKPPEAKKCQYTCCEAGMKLCGSDCCDARRPRSARTRPVTRPWKFPATIRMPGVQMFWLRGPGTAAACVPKRPDSSELSTLVQQGFCQVWGRKVWCEHRDDAVLRCHLS